MGPEGAAAAVGTLSKLGTGVAAATEGGAAAAALTPAVETMAMPEVAAAPVAPVMEQMTFHDIGGADFVDSSVQQAINSSAPNAEAEIQGLVDKFTADDFDETTLDRLAAAEKADQLEWKDGQPVIHSPDEVLDTTRVGGTPGEIPEIAEPSQDTPTPPGTPEDGTDGKAPSSDGSASPAETPAAGNTVDADAAKTPQAETPQKLTNPGEFDEAKTRADIERNNQGLPKDEIDRKVNEARKSHATSVEAYNKQQASRSPEEIRDEYTDRLQKGEKLTNDEIQELNDAKVAIKEKKELADFEKRMADPDDSLTAEEMRRYNELKSKNETGSLPEGDERKMLENQSKQLIDKLRNGEGDMLENILQLEDVQRQLTLGERLSKSMSKRFADALQSAIDGGKLENDEAERVIDKIGELYGLEMQLSQLPAQYAKLEEQADELDKQIDDTKNVKFDQSKESQQRRLILYNSYVQLTMVESQMVQMSRINVELAQKFNSVMNQIDFALGRKNIISFALKGTANAATKHVSSLTRPNLRSTRHRDLLGFLDQ